MKILHFCCWIKTGYKEIEDSTFETSADADDILPVYFYFFFACKASTYIFSVAIFTTFSNVYKAFHYIFSVEFLTTFCDVFKPSDYFFCVEILTTFFVYLLFHVKLCRSWCLFMLLTMLIHFLIREKRQKRLRQVANMICKKTIKIVSW